MASASSTCSYGTRNRSVARRWQTYSSRWSSHSKTTFCGASAQGSQLVLHETVRVGAAAGFEIYVENSGQLPSQTSATFSQCDVRFNAVDANGVAISEQTLRFRYVVYYSDGSVSYDYAHRVNGAYVVLAHTPYTRWATVRNIIVIASAQPGVAAAKQASVSAPSGTAAPVSYYIPSPEDLSLLDPLRGLDTPTSPLADLIAPDLRVLVNFGYPPPYSPIPFPPINPFPPVLPFPFPPPPV
ncbi:hypothetical protein BH10CYA1_BH10CYA1_03400 [soil metagenome]